MTSDRSASRPGSRRRYSDELQAQVLAECNAPGASVAKVAMSHGINANVVHRWRKLAREGLPLAVPAPTCEFLPVSLPAIPASTHTSGIQIQLRRGPTAITITWPVSAAAEFGAWMVSDQPHHP